MVPTDKPNVALYLIEDFIKGSTPIFSQITQASTDMSLNQVPPAADSRIIRVHHNETVVEVPTAMNLKASATETTSKSPNHAYSSFLIIIFCTTVRMLTHIATLF